MSALHWLAIAVALVLVGGCNFAHSVGFIRGQKDMRARTQGMLDSLILQSERRERELARLKRDCAAFGERVAAMERAAKEQA